MNRNKSQISESEVPILDTQIGTRFGIAADKLGTREEAAEKLGIAKSTLMRYIKENGVSIPTEVMAQLARLSGVRLDWLILGLEPMSPSDPAASRSNDQPRQDEPYNRAMLMGVILGLEDFFDAEDYDPAPEQRAKLTVLMYDLALAKGRVDREEMLSILKVAA